MIARGTESFELVGDYHNGPLSVLLPFGIFGAIAFVWLMVAGLRVVYQNYRFGDPAFHHLNAFLFAYFAAKVIFFFAVFGSLHSDLPVFLGLLGLSISLNGGVAKPEVVSQPEGICNRFTLQRIAITGWLAADTALRLTANAAGRYLAAPVVVIW